MEARKRLRESCYQSTGIDGSLDTKSSKTTVTQRGSTEASCLSMEGVSPQLRIGVLLIGTTDMFDSFGFATKKNVLPEGVNLT